MKILELKLKNFLPILAGIGKEEILLDLRGSNDLISVFIGKIGSGKTYILSHLQPFSTVGTMDVRNSDDPIIEGKDGEKVIVYEKDDHEYVITHEYKWTGKTHSKKSYITKDGVELNDNGNGSSFKDIIQLEFGIDQSFMRLLRLGPNVINFINMKATERKSYIASLLADTELYVALYKAWSAELRTLNTKANILMNKLNSHGKKYEDLEKELDDIDEDIEDLNQELVDKNEVKYKLQAENSTLMGDLSYAQLQEKRSTLEKEIMEARDGVSRITASLEKFCSYPELTDISKKIGKLDQKIEELTASHTKLEADHESLLLTLNTLKDKKAISGSADHLETLKETYNELLKKDAEYKRQLQGFKCDYSSTFLSGFLGDLNLINVLINEISQYDVETVTTVFNSDSSIIQYSKKKIEILGYRKLKVEKMIHNLKFAESYDPPGKLYFPPFCPTKSCPYYTTHPCTLQDKVGKEREMLDEIMKYQNELKDLDIEISRYNDYPLLYSKISSLKEYWKKAKEVLSSIHALNVSSLLSTLSTDRYQNWYDYDRIVNTIDLIEKRDKYFELTEKIKVIKNEITELELSDSEKIDQDISETTTKIQQIASEMEQLEIDKREAENSLANCNQMYLDLSEKANMEQSLENLKQLISDHTQEVSTIDANDAKIKDNLVILQNTNRTIAELQSKLKAKTNDRDQLNAKLNDIRFTATELDSVMNEQKYMSYMVDATSSKKGIPLVMVQIFLESCRDTLNDMIYAVCEDDLEIMPFSINETEFKIPYMVNGKVVDDISKASQGQSSIVSTCMSFALIKQVGIQSGSLEYNIPLLDEMDGPLHKSDKQKFIAILLKYLKEIRSEQCFVITHDDNTFDGYPVQVIMTTDEHVNQEKYTNIIKL